MSVSEQKSALRQRMLQLRSGVSERDAKRAAREMAALFHGHVPIRKSDVVAGYAPMRGEIDDLLLLEALTEERIVCALPAVVDEDAPLEFRQFSRGMRMVPHPKFKMLEPVESAHSLVPTIVIVPLLAADAAGRRLGYGGGFYDRTLAQLQKDSARGEDLLIIGVCYDAQVVAAVPAEAHDIRLDCIITDQRVIICE